LWQENETDILIKALYNKDIAKETEQISQLKKEILSLEKNIIDFDEIQNSNEIEIKNEDENSHCYQQSTSNKEIKKLDNINHSENIMCELDQNLVNPKSEIRKLSISDTASKSGLSFEEEEKINKIMIQNKKNYDKLIIGLIIGDSHTDIFQLLDELIPTNENKYISKGGIESRYEIIEVNNKKLCLKIYCSDSERATYNIKKCRFKKYI